MGQAIIPIIVFISILFGSRVEVFAQSVVRPTRSVYLPGILGHWYVIGYLPGRALPDDCLNVWSEHRLHAPVQEAEFEMTFSCVRKNWLGNIVTVQRKNAVRIPRSHPNRFQFNDIPFEGKLEMDPGAPARWLVGWVDYWILEAEPSELSTPDAYFIVGGPKKTVLTIFSRVPHMDERVYQKLLERLERIGYERLAERIIRIRR